MSYLMSFNANMLFFTNGSNRYCIIINFPSIVGRVGFTKFFGKTRLNLHLNSQRLFNGLPMPLCCFSIACEN